MTSGISRAAALAAMTSAGLMFSACEGIVDTRSEYETVEDRQPVDTVERFSVELDYGVGNVEVRRSDQADTLYAYRLDYDRLHYEMETDFSPGVPEARFRLELDSTGRLPLGDNNNDLLFELSGDVPLDLAFSTGVGESYFDLTGLDVRRVRHRGGVGRSELTFDTPQREPIESIDVNSGVGEVVFRGLGNTRVRRFRCDGGVGEATLDFTGEWGEGETRAYIDLGVGELRMIIPEDLAVEVVVDEGFLSEVWARDFERRGNRYVRNAEPGQPARLVMEIDSGLGGVRMELR